MFWARHALQKNETMTASISENVRKELDDAAWLTELDVKVKTPSKIETQPGTARPTAPETTTAPETLSPTPAPIIDDYADDAISVFSSRHFIIFGLSLFALI